MMLSECCKDWVLVYYSIEVSYYVCSKCEQACDTIFTITNGMEAAINAEVQPG